MKYTQLRWLAMIAVAIVSLVGASSALADPYKWTIGQVQAMTNSTDATNLSTINSITPIPNGIQLDVTFRVGQMDSSFLPDFGQTFARIGIGGGLGGSGLDLSSFTSSSVKITSTTDVTAQSFLKTAFTENGTTIDDGDATPGEAFNFYFWEHSDGVAANTATDADLDFASAAEFGAWDIANPTAVQGLDVTQEWGLQIGKFSGIVLGEPVNATITLEGVPEPSTVALLMLGVVGLAGRARRRQG